MVLTLAGLLAAASACASNEPPVPASLEQPGVRIASFNVWGLPWPITPRRTARLTAIDTWLAEEGFDLVALQEAWRGARPLLSSRVRYPSTHRDSGLALYSRLPVEELGFVAFEQARGPDRFKAKGVWWVQVELPSGSCAVGVLHLQAGASTSSSQIRRAQVERVLASRPQGPVVLLGDFNLHRGNAIDRGTHALLVDNGLAEARPLRDRGTSRYGDHRLDRMYVSLPASWTVSRARTLREVEHSDHFPVVAELARER